MSSMSGLNRIVQRAAWICAAGAVISLAACTEPGEMTGVGAAAGGAMGAGLGAIVGSQTGDAGAGLVIGGIAGAGAGAAIGNAFEFQDQRLQSRDEEIKSQGRTIRAQQAEINELRHMSQDSVKFKAPTVAMRAPQGGGSPYSVQSSSGAISQSRGQLSRTIPLNAVPLRPVPPQSEPIVVRSSGAVSSGAASSGSLRHVPTIPVRSAPAHKAQDSAVHESDIAVHRPFVSVEPTAKMAKQEAAADIPVKHADNAPSKAASSEKLSSEGFVSTEPVVEDMGAVEKTVEKSIEEPIVVVEKPVKAETSILEPLQDSSSRAALNRGSVDCSQAQSEELAAKQAAETPDKLFHYRRALRLCPTEANFHVGLAQVYEELGRSDDAQFEYAEAQRLDPDHAVAGQKVAQKGFTSTEKY